MQKWGHVIAKGFGGPGQGVFNFPFPTPKIHIVALFLIGCYSEKKSILALSIYSTKIIYTNGLNEVIPSLALGCVKLKPV